MVEHFILRWGLHDFIPETCELAVRLLTQDDSVLVQPFNLFAGRSLLILMNNLNSYLSDPHNP